MNRRLFTLALPVIAVPPLVGCTTTSGSTTDAESKRKEIDAAVDGGLSRLFSTAPSAQALARQAKGVLVFPKILAGGFVVGGEYGEGALRVNGASVAYYRISAASFGLLAGAQSKGLVLMFMTDDALKRFQASKGWTAGVDGSVALATIGANGLVDTETARAPIIGFGFTNAGLMVNLSVEGSKIGRLDI